MAARKLRMKLVCVVFEIIAEDLGHFPPDHPIVTQNTDTKELVRTGMMSTGCTLGLNIQMARPRSPQLRSSKKSWQCKSALRLKTDRVPALKYSIPLYGSLAFLACGIVKTNFVCKRRVYAVGRIPDPLTGGYYGHNNSIVGGPSGGLAYRTAKRVGQEKAQPSVRIAKQDLALLFI